MVEKTLQENAAQDAQPTAASRITGALSELRDLIRPRESSEGYACMMTMARIHATPTSAHVFVVGKDRKRVPFHTDCMLDYGKDGTVAIVQLGLPPDRQAAKVPGPSLTVKKILQQSALPSELLPQALQLRQTRMSQAAIDAILPHLDRTAPMMMTSMIDFGRD